MAKQLSKGEQNKEIVGRWFTCFWGKDVDLSIVEQIGLDDGVTALTQLGLPKKA